MSVRTRVMRRQTNAEVVDHGSTSAAGEAGRREGKAPIVEEEPRAGSGAYGSTSSSLVVEASHKDDDGKNEIAEANRSVHEANNDVSNWAPLREYFMRAEPKLNWDQMPLELGGIYTATEREKVTVKQLMTEAKNMMWNTEVAIRSYMMLRQRFIHPNVSAASNGVPSSQSLGANMTTGMSPQVTSSSLTPVYDFYSGLPKRPSPFMQHTVARFEEYLTECRQWIGELEQLILVDSEKTTSSSGLTLLQSLPNVMSNVHDFFVHVAAKVESLHQYVESMKTAYLADQRRRGDGNDPFLEADRRETAKQEAAARRVHPTLHLPATSAQPSTQGAGLFASSAMTVSNVPQQPLESSGAGSSKSGLSIFSIPSAPAAVSSSLSLFATPAASTPASTLFGSGVSPQSTPFGTSSSSLFGSAQTSSLFGSANKPSLSITPAIGSFGSSPLFSTPTLSAGVVTSSGASFGATSKSSRPKSRTTRR